ncbi:putative D-alanine-D-alanyl carrier ligase domain protein [Bordetella holmesii ATCC 51541]|nr:putative D-alanine-D-alanyl carrier ligase domain protein [Bordetella holmesii ATCC 51541]
MRFDLSTFEFVASERDPQALAVVGADGQLSWAELEQAAAAWVERARARNITADVPVVVYGHKQTGFSWPWSAH